MRTPRLTAEVVGEFREDHAKALILVTQKIWQRVAKERTCDWHEAMKEYVQSNQQRQ